MKEKIVIPVLFWLLSQIGALYGQDTQFSLSNASVSGGAVTEIEAKVKDFTTILSFQFSINWDPNQFEFVSIDGFNLSGLDEQNFGLNTIAEGYLSCLWWDNTAGGITLPDETSIFKITLKAACSEGGLFFPVSFSEDPVEIVVVQLIGTIFMEIDAIMEDASVEVVPSPQLFSVQGADNLCAGVSNGMIDLTVEGTTPISFLWNNGASTEDINNLSAGNYGCTITDANACSLAADDIEISEPTQVELASFQIKNDTSGNMNGSIEITIEGGTPPYSFSWSKGGIDEDLTDLPAGIYQCTITDANGCSIVTDTFVVDNITAVNSLPSFSYFRVFPNPASTTIYIDFELEYPMDIEFYLYDRQGQSIFSKRYNLANGELKAELDISAVGKGLYLVQVRSSGKSVFRKVTVIE